MLDLSTSEALASCRQEPVVGPTRSTRAHKIETAIESTCTKYQTLLRRKKFSEPFVKRVLGA